MAKLIIFLRAHCIKQMRKYLFIIPITILFLLAAIISYLNFLGIKTDKFNELIYSKISQLNPKLSS